MFPFGRYVGLGPFELMRELSEEMERAYRGAIPSTQRRAAEYACRDGRVAAEDFFLCGTKCPFGEECRTVLPDHVPETLGALVDHLAHQNRVQRNAPHKDDTKVVVWAHNSHLGDARATQMWLKSRARAGA